MGWASSYIEELRAGRTVQFRPKGNSMTGRVESGQLCTVIPAHPSLLKKDSIVLCKVKSAEYLHLVKDIKDDQFLIGNNKGRINGWIDKDAIFGVLILTGE